MRKLRAKYNIQILKIIVIISLLSISCFLTYYFYYILKINIVFSHFFYLPIILACIWWKKKGLGIPIFLAGLLILFPIFYRINIFEIDIFFRAAMLIIVGIVVAILSEYVSKVEELHDAYDRLKFYRDLFNHDINNIFQAIISSIELFSNYQIIPENVEILNELIDIIRKQYIRGVKLLSNVQKLSELEESETFLKKIHIYKILNRSISFVRNIFKNKIIEIKIESPNDKLFVYANDLLSDVFENLLINAVIHNENLKVEILIRISKLQKEKKSNVKMEFIDNGKGILDAYKKLIFQKGYEKEKGSKSMGIGLTLVKKIIKTYNGKIWVEDKIKGDYTQGSNFILLIQEAS